MNSSLRDAVVAVRDFAEAVRLQYSKNLELFAAKAPVSDLPQFPVEALTAAQTFTEAEGQSSFIVLGHVEETKIRLVDMEALCWLANDSIAFDNGARRKEIEANPALRNVVVMFGERAVARAIYLKALLGGLVRAIDADLFERAAKNEAGLPAVAAPLSQQSMEEFRADLEAAIPKMVFQREVADYARYCGFPILPVALSHKLKDHQAMNGVLLTRSLAEQFRAHLEKNLNPAARA